MVELSHTQRLRKALDDLKPRYEFYATILSNYDGDTVTMLVDLGLGTFVKHSFRLYGINTPELRRPTYDEGKAAKDFLADLLDKHAVAKTHFGNTFLIRTHKRNRAQEGRQRAKKGKYGRYLIEILGVDRESAQIINLNDTLVDNNHAEPYLL